MRYNFCNNFNMRCVILNSTNFFDEEIILYKAEPKRGKRNEYIEYIEIHTLNIFPSHLVALIVLFIIRFCDTKE